MPANIGLGTVQFGVNYGVSNTQGMPTDEQISDILIMARRSGIDVLDTAALYGSSEEVLGLQDLTGFKIITKTPRFALTQIQQGQVAELHTIFRRSLSRLRQTNIYALLSHHAEDLLVPGGEQLWHAMSEIKHSGQVKRIGASIYNGVQLDALMEKYPLDIVQMPINILDQRLIRGGQLSRLKAAGVEVHARSVFLQGLLLMDEVPSYFEPIKPDLNRLKTIISARGLKSTQAALAFVRDLSGVDVVLVGVTDLDQLKTCVMDFNSGYTFDGRGYACDIVDFVDPTRWDIK